ncbi:hypothetical protein AJ88_35820 [Mesorhizobium amorphae CCBAU 01583]|nr:hypothetical protein AJ88_35820 [Mesorhizobium amorphae CCBAU 01583]
MDSGRLSRQRPPIFRRYKRAAALAAPVKSVVPDGFPNFRWLGSDRLLAASGSKSLGVFNVKDGKRVEPAESVDAGELKADWEADRATSPDGAVRILQDGYDLTILETLSGSRHRLTHDGTYDLAYGVIAIMDPSRLHDG